MINLRPNQRDESMDENLGGLCEPIFIRTRCCRHGQIRCILATNTLEICGMYAVSGDNES